MFVDHVPRAAGTTLGRVERTHMADGFRVVFPALPNSDYLTCLAAGMST